MSTTLLVQLSTVSAEHECRLRRFLAALVVSSFCSLTISCPGFLVWLICLVGIPLLTILFVVLVGVILRVCDIHQCPHDSFCASVELQYPLSCQLRHMIRH